MAGLAYLTCLLSQRPIIQGHCTQGLMKEAVIMHSVQGTHKPNSKRTPETNTCKTFATQLTARISESACDSGRPIQGFAVRPAPGIWYREYTDGDLDTECASDGNDGRDADESNICPATGSLRYFFAMKCMSVISRFFRGAVPAFQGTTVSAFIYRP